MDHNEEWHSETEERSNRRAIGIRAIVIATISMMLIFGAGIYYLFYDLGNDLFSGMCGNQIRTSAVQPEKGDYRLVEFQRDCGATTDYSYQLSIIKNGQELSKDKGNILVTDQEFKVKWVNENTIEVRGIFNKDYRKRSEYKGIKIIYR